MKSIHTKKKNDQSNPSKVQPEEFQRCELCNVPIFQNPCSDERSKDVFQGRGNVLCNKCAALLAKMPNEQAIQSLNNAAETYKR